MIVVNDRRRKKKAWERNSRLKKVLLKVLCLALIDGLIDKDKKLA